MRVLFLQTHAGLFRNFESTLALLAERGHEVHVSFDSHRYPSDAFAALCARSPTLTSGLTPALAADRWAALSHQVRAASDYVRYLDARYARSDRLRARARRQVPLYLRALIHRRTARPVDRVLRAVERRLPVDPAALAFVRERAPDVVVISPLFGSPVQLEALRAARALGVPTCLAVASWDNLTNKGLIRELPDVVTVWNAAQRDEAVTLHGVPPERVVVTGAQSFDEWFARQPATSREEFCARVGLPADRALVLYLGSSSFIAPDEAAFAARWLEALRAHPDERLRTAAVLFRPHPQNAAQWDALGRRDDVAVWPPPDAAPQRTGRADWSREDFYDSMHHAHAVVGVNTTAMIDSAVVGRGVYTVLDPAFAHSQAGTLHFEHLVSVNGGLVHAGRDLDEHLGQLAAGLDGAPSERSRRFVEAFVRPHGLGQPATPFLVDALERTAGAPRAAPAPAPARRPLALQPLAGLAALERRRQRMLRSKSAPARIARRLLS